MIDKREIELKSREYEVLTSNIQKDYLFGWLLHYLFTHSEFKDIIFLKGGNALRKAYFIQTRFSKDIDFGTPHDIDLSFLKQEVKNACKYIREQSGIQFVGRR
jgi:predicted nucleotidyltransferase component of viral defense system